MITRIYPLDEPRRPASGSNNLWYEDRRTDQVIVFVHGVLSDSSGCWYKEPSDNQPGVYWPDLLLRDTCFASYSIYLGGYYTGVKATQYEVSDCAEELYSALKRRDKEEGALSVMEHKTVIFVCHSMGGIVVRYMLTTRPWEFENSRIGLVLIASPSSGSPWANRLDLLLQYFKHQQGVELEWGNWNLEDLDGRFRIVVSAKRIKLLGAEACENKFIFDGKWLPPLEPVVSRHSAGAYFDRVRMLADTDHFTCVKPTGRDHPAYQFLLDFHNTFSGDRTNKLEPTAALSPAPSTASGSSYSSLCWDVRIDEEGDAYNELTYKDVVLPRKRPYVFALPPAEVQSGHTTEFELIWDGRTTEGASLKNTTVSTPSKVEMFVEFSNLPTDKNPASFAVRCWDWNVYSMNMEEYKQKANWREDGMDYAEKYIPQTWKNFTMLLQFPQQIVFAKRPFFDIYHASNSANQVRSDELTAEYQHCFHYSNSLNQAVLSIQQPPTPFSYRISWLLGESRLSVTSALIPEQRLRQRTFARKMLQMRRTVDGEEANNPDEAKQLEEGINSVIASVAEHVQQIIGNAELDPASLEISLMVLDEDRPQLPSMGTKKLPVLRMVVGTLLEEPGYRSLAIFVGDGNAGRAWKRRMARVFDQKERDPKRHVYVPISPSRPHSFLVSIPLIDPESDALIYGILNIGTIDSEQAELLRKVGASQEVQSTTSYVQSYVLKRLMELLRL
jgi:pimeloyl-ACP methyl ester carboxylesterase